MSTNTNRPPMGSRQGGAGTNTNGQSQHSADRRFGQPVRTVYSADGQHTAGIIRRSSGGDTCFTRFVWTSRGHLVERPRGWALEPGTIDTLRAFSTPPPLLAFLEQDTHTVYEATVADFDRWGVRLERRFGPQVCLPLDYWRIDGQPPTAKAARPDEPPEPPEPGEPIAPASVPDTAQLALWTF